MKKYLGILIMLVLLLSFFTVGVAGMSRNAVLDGQVPATSYTDTVMALVVAFFQDPRVLTVLGLIVLDFVLGVAAALRTNTWDWKKVANFYQTNVLPFILGYLAFYVAANLIPDFELLGEWSYLVGEGALLVAWGAILASLCNDIVSHIRALGLGAILDDVPEQ